MSFKISADKCTGCGACVPECSVDAIKAVGDKYEITDECVDCAICVDACPEGAIFE